MGVFLGRVSFWADCTSGMGELLGWVRLSSGMRELLFWDGWTSGVSVLLGVVYFRDARVSGMHALLFRDG